MAASSKVIILYFDDFSGNNSFKAIEAKYRQKGIACHGIKLSNAPPRDQSINASDVQWPENLSIDENTRILIIGHSRPGAEHFSSDDRKKLYPAEIAKIFKPHISPHTRTIRVRLIACCAALRSSNTPVIDAHLFDTISQDSLANQLSLQLISSDIDSIITCNKELVIIDDKGTYSTLTIPMYTQKNWSMHDYHILQDSSYTQEEKDLKSAQYETLGRLMHGRMELKRPDSKITIERSKKSASFIPDQYDHFTHFMQPYIVAQEKWKEKALEHNKNYRRIMREKCDAVKKQHHLKSSDIDAEFIELEEEITESIFIADPEIIAAKIEKAKMAIEANIILLEDELKELRSGALKKKSNISFESDEFDDFFATAAPVKKQPSNSERIKKLEILIAKAKNTLPMLDSLKKEVLQERHAYTEKANEDWQEFIKELHSTEKQCIENYRENKDIIHLILKIEESLSQGSANPSFFIDPNHPIPQIKRTLEVIRRSDAPPEEKIQQLREIVAKNKPLLGEFIAPIEDLTKSQAAFSASPRFD